MQDPMINGVELGWLALMSVKPLTSLTGGWTEYGRINSASPFSEQLGNQQYQLDLRSLHRDIYSQSSQSRDRSRNPEESH